MPDMTMYDLLVILTLAGVFVTGLWAMIFAFLYGFMKRLDKIILLLEADRKA